MVCLKVHYYKLIKFKIGLYFENIIFNFIASDKIENIIFNFIASDKNDWYSSYDGLRPLVIWIKIACILLFNLLIKKLKILILKIFEKLKPNCEFEFNFFIFLEIDFILEL